MKIKIPTLSALLEEKCKRVKWFAWKPVRVNEETFVWLEYVIRSGKIVNDWPATRWVDYTYELIE